MDPDTRIRPDPAKEGEFAGRISSLIDAGALAVLMSIGHRTGLFDVLANREPSAAEGLAELAGLNADFVAIWLERMARSGILSHDSASNTYALPAEHAAPIAGATSMVSLSALAECVSLMGATEDQILEGFDLNGRIPYDARPSFRQVISKASDSVLIETMLDSIVPLVPGLLDALRTGIAVLDIGCGSGRLVNLIAANFPQSRFCGYDPLTRHIDRAMNHSFWLGLSNVQFRVQDVLTLEEVTQYDLITDFDAVKNGTQSRPALTNVARALRPGGSFLMQQLGSPMGLEETLTFPPESAMQTVYTLRRMARRSTGQTRSEPLRREQVRRILLESGFGSVEMHPSPHHVDNCTFVAMRSD